MHPDFLPTTTANLSQKSLLQLVWLMTNPNTRLAELRIEGKYKLLRECMIAAFNMITQTRSHTNRARFREHFEGRLDEMEDVEIDTFALEAGWKDEWMMVRLAARGKAPGRPPSNNSRVLSHAVPTPARAVPFPKASAARPIHDGNRNGPIVGHR